MSIKIENIVLPNSEQFKSIIVGMRHPLLSYDRMDSKECHNIFCGECNEECAPYTNGFILGSNDLDLMMRLRNAGSEHRKFMRMITVYMDITAPLYWWKEFDTYKVGTVCNSTSTMHKIHAKEFVRDDFSWDHLSGDNCIPDHDYQSSTYVLDLVIASLNFWRHEYLTGAESGIKNDKRAWWQMIQLLPSSYNQTRTVMLNYEVLTNIYRSRKDHKLDEWREFCKFIKTLPYSELIIG